MTWLRSLAPRDLRAFIALIASIAGSAVLTIIIAGIVWILWRGGWPSGTELARIDKIGLIAVLLTVIMGVTLVGQQLAINRRQMKGSAFGASFEASGGDEPGDPVPKALAEAGDALKDKASELKDETP